MDRYSYRQLSAFLIILGLGILSIIASGGGGGGDGVTSPGTLQFSAATYSGAEDSGPITITVTRTGGSEGAATVVVNDTGSGSATSGTDYTAITPTTLNWTDGDTSSKTITVTPIADTTYEPDETINLALTNSTGASFGTQSSATVTITNDDVPVPGTLQFSSATYSGAEDSGPITITVTRTGGSDLAASVEISDAGCSAGNCATSGTDYMAITPTTLNWANGDSSSKTFTVTPIADGAIEPDETVNLALGNATGATLGATTSATVTITNDDVPGPGTLQFSLSDYTVSEDAGTATITVTRTGGDVGAVTVDYATSAGTATAGSDYVDNAGTLSWVDGDGSAKTFSVTILNDVIVEKPETVNLALTNPTGGASLGTQDTATLTINSEDTNLTMNIGNGSNWVAFQDGPTGVWTQWSPTSGNTYNFPVTDASGRYGVAFHRLESDYLTRSVNKTYIIQSTISELNNLDLFNNTTYTVSGILSNHTTGYDSAGAAMHTKEYGTNQTLPQTYTLYGVPEGTRDLLAFEWNSTTGAIGHVYINRDMNITGDLSGQDVDLTADGLTPTITYNDFNGGSGTTGQLLEVYYATNNGTSVNLISEPYDGSTAVPYPYITNLTLAGDSYSFQVYKNFGGYGKYRIRNYTAASDPGSQTIGLASVKDNPAVTMSNTQVTSLNYVPDPTSFSGSPVFRGYQIDLDQSVATGAHWKFIVTPGWIGTSTTYSYPTLSTISGFSASWDLLINNYLTGTVSELTSNNGTGLNLITRKTTGPSSLNLDPSSWVLEKKLAQNDSLKLDIAEEYFTILW